jgi:hypothetical protein
MAKLIGEAVAEGSGLGLAIAHGVASGIGGELVLTSPLPGRQSGFEARFCVRKEINGRSARCEARVRAMLSCRKTVVCHSLKKTYVRQTRY